jgi:hypothetical protein
MGFNRAIAPSPSLTEEDLTARMAGIGMNFAVRPMPEPNIEDTLLLASLEGMEKQDLRVLAVLVTWLGVHSPWVNADRLTRLIAIENLPRVRAFWCAVAQWLKKDRRFARLARLYAGPRVRVIETGAEFQVKRFGEDKRFRETGILVAANLLRNRASDVLDPAELARRHRAYRRRVMMGPSYRADMWAALEGDSRLTAAELARTAYGSFATAWHVRRDYTLLAKERKLLTLAH